MKLGEKTHNQKKYNPNLKKLWKEGNGDFG